MISLNMKNELDLDTHTIYGSVNNLMDVLNAIPAEASPEAYRYLNEFNLKEALLLLQSIVENIEIANAQKPTETGPTLV